MLRKEKATVVTGVTVNSRRTDFWTKNPLATAVATKMVRDRMQATPTPGSGVAVASENIFNELLQRRAQKNLDAETIMALQPDVKLIRHMITSVIMSPIDMDSGGITHTIDDTDLPGSVTNPILEIIRDHFTNYIDLNEELPEIIPEALFDRGAAARIIVPEAVIDDMINQGTSYTVEDFRQSVLDDEGVTFRPLGILGDVTTMQQANTRNQTAAKMGSAKVSMESAFQMDIGMPSTKINDMASITDNLSVLKMPILKDRMRKGYMQQAMRGHVGVSVNRAALESHRSGQNKSRDRNQHLSDVRRLRDSLYAQNPSIQNAGRQISIMKQASQASRSSIGHPLMMRVRSGSLVPAFMPGSPDVHLGYVMALDSTGYPIDIVAEMKENMSKGLGNLDNTQAMNLTSTLLQQTQILNSGYQYDSGRASNQERLRLWTQIYEENILNRIKNGIVGSNVRLGRNEDFYSMILARNWANEIVHLVFIPAEQVAYFAYEYDENGMGKSLLDGVAQTSTLRIMTNFANFMASVNNAVGRTKVTINIDPRSTDPEKDYHIIVDEYLRSQAGASPTDVTSASEMFRTLRSMGVCFEVQGNTGLPNTTVDVEAFQSGKLQIDQEFTNSLRNDQYMGLYVTPDMVDMTQQGDFAITRWTSNQLFTKRIMTLQRITCKHTQKLVETYVRSDGELLRRIQQAIRENQDKLPEFYRTRTPQDDPIQFQSVIDEFFRAYRVELPNPNSTKADQALEQIQKQEQFWTEIVKHYVSNELYDPALGDGQKEYIDTISKMYVAYFMRDYIETEGLAPEMADFMRKGTEDNPALSLLKESSIHWGNMTGNMGDFFAAMQERRDLRLQFLEASNPKLAEHIRGGGTAADFEDDTENEDDNTPPGGGDNFNLDDAPVDDAPQDNDTDNNNTEENNTDDEFNSTANQFDDAEQQAKDSADAANSGTQSGDSGGPAPGGAPTVSGGQPASPEAP